MSRQHGSLPPAGDNQPKRRSLAADATRQKRIDRIEAGKTQLWKFNLRISELANFIVFVPAVLLLWSQSWAAWALAPACVIAVGGMWAFARRMRRSEARLCRHMVFLARYRRRCAMCRYCIQGLAGPRCPECAFGFDPDDDRHLLIPLMNRIFSGQGRQVSAVAIVAGMTAVVMLAQNAGWRWYVAWSGLLLAAMHVLFAVWIVQARRMQAAFERSGVRPFRDLPDPRRPADGRLLRIQYGGALLRWAMMTAICGGLAVIVNLDASVLRVLSFGGGAGTLFVSLGVPVLAYVLGVGMLMRYCVSKLMWRMRIRLAAVPTVVGH
ncbi:MAG: hypothetical protein H6818_08040 [Phycisphaerales bacterium]|nr:hypothetical protein [Phycisphaerales bacterium]MCB9862523.1 hypothetical protein [Phycisphaerales bacterium]